MTAYTAPLRDMQFVLHELLGIEQQFAGIERFQEASAEVTDTILREAAKLCQELIFPTLHSSDRQGCQWIDGKVATPAEFKRIYNTLLEGGWLSLAGPTAYGGQGLPYTIALFFDEMLQSANLSFSLYTGLSHGAAIALEQYADEQQKQCYLPPLIEGLWSGVMCLTEPQCGTDLGLLRTRAEADDDGSYRITGNKIFITGGEQDLTENIVHFVLARIKGAPPGVRGISMFLVPKYLPQDDRQLGPRNSMSCDSIEHKMGIKGASTCTMSYNAATGYLLGEPERGLRAMFSMMNYERLMVGQQGLSVAEVAYQSASQYARERFQGRRAAHGTDVDGPADPIIVHPDIRRLLLTTRALNEGARGLLGWVTMQYDLSQAHPDPAVRQKAEDKVALFTPIVKAFVTDNGFNACNDCLQVFGGHGYIKDHGMEQLVRDVRIAQIYEGANGIHALDLVARKLPMHGGRAIKDYLAEIEVFTRNADNHSALDEFTQPLSRVLAVLRSDTAWITDAAQKDPNEVGAASYDYLRLIGLVAFAYIWAQAANIALARQTEDNSGFYQAKLQTARYFYQRLLPQSTALSQIIRSGCRSLMDMDAEAFTNTAAL